MSGFGIRAFKKLKEEHTHQEKRQYFPHIVYGENTFAVLTYLKLVEKFGVESVRLVCANYIDKQSLLNEWKCSPNLLRDEGIASALSERYIKLEIIATGQQSVFYKDSKFHLFNARTKPFEIMPGEEYFQPMAYSMNLEGLFTTETWNNLDEVLRPQLSKYIDRIELSTPTDLVQKVNYVLQTGQFESLECEHLYWCESPKNFYAKVENKNKINDALGEFCNSIEHQPAMAVAFEVDSQVYEGHGTVYLPQSVTHEWGHFICDFKEYDPATKKQKFVCMMLVNEDEVNEEELAKKINLMKRVIERIMPNFSKARHNEHIHYSSCMFINNVKDELADDIEFDHAHLHFLGAGAPISGQENSQAWRYLPRALMTYFQLEV
jgi:hypothetical protein